MPHQQLPNGILIALEGIDGSGKSTLAHNLFTLLQEKQYDAVLTREPGATALGAQLREIIQHQTIPLCGQAQYLLFAADRAQHFSDVIIPNLHAKKLIAWLIHPLHTNAMAMDLILIWSALSTNGL